MKFAVVVFPGSNSDRDAWYAASHVLGAAGRARLAQGHRPGRRRRRDPARRLRARRLPAHRRDRALLADHGGGARFAERGGPVLGICNGFQVLLEAGLLPGAMVRNRERQVRLRARAVRVEQTDTPFTARLRGRAGAAPADRARRGQLLRRPRTCSRRSRRTPGDLPLHRRRRRSRPTKANPNGSVNNIAGICNARAQRRRPDAASRARLRAVARQRRRPLSSSQSVVQALARAVSHATR